MYLAHGFYFHQDDLISLLVLAETTVSYLGCHCSHSSIIAISFPKKSTTRHGFQNLSGIMSFLWSDPLIDHPGLSETSKVLIWHQLQSLPDKYIIISLVSVCLSLNLSSKSKNFILLAAFSLVTRILFAVLSIYKSYKIIHSLNIR